MARVRYTSLDDIINSEDGKLLGEKILSVRLIGPLHVDFSFCNRLTAVFTIIFFLIKQSINTVKSGC